VFGESPRALAASQGVGTSVLVRGTNLLGPTAVSFNGPAATKVKSLGAGYIRVTVPSGAISGPMSVTTPTGSITSTGTFTVN